jgi:hypothetical protein
MCKKEMFRGHPQENSFPACRVGQYFGEEKVLLYCVSIILNHSVASDPHLQVMCSYQCDYREQNDYRVNKIRREKPADWPSNKIPCCVDANQRRRRGISLVSLCHS